MFCAEIFMIVEGAYWMILSGHAIFLQFSPNLQARFPSLVIVFILYTLTLTLTLVLDICHRRRATFALSGVVSLLC